MFKLCFNISFHYLWKQVLDFISLNLYNVSYPHFLQYCTVSKRLILTVIVFYFKYILMLFCGLVFLITCWYRKAYDLYRWKMFPIMCFHIPKQQMLSFFLSSSNFAVQLHFYLSTIIACFLLKMHIFSHIYHSLIYSLNDAWKRT